MGPVVEHELVANNYPLYLDVLDKKEEIEEEIEALERVHKMVVSGDNVCGRCKAGTSADGGKYAADGTCLSWCSSQGYCGATDAYKVGGTDCTSTIRKEDYEANAAEQNAIVRRIKILFADANKALSLQTEASERSRPTSEGLRASIGMLEKKLEDLLSKKGGVAARARTAEELSTSARRKDSEYLQMVAYLVGIIVVLLLCAQSAASSEQNVYETAILVLVLVIAAYYLVVNYIL